MRFARLIEFKTGQLLISITTDSDVDGFVLSLETYHRGGFIRTGIPFTSFGDASESMEELSQERAEQIYRGLTDVVDDPSLLTKGRGADGVLEKFEQWLREEAAKK